MNTMIMRTLKKELPQEQSEELPRGLKARFEKNINRHKGLEWVKVKAKLEDNSEKLWSLNEMERTGGEPGVISYDKKTGITYYAIVQRKVLKVVEMFVTTVKGRRQGISLNQKITLLMWLLPWGLSF